MLVVAYHLDISPRSRLNVDGHPVTGPFLPTIPAKGRMFAGSKLRFHRPVEIGQTTHVKQRVTDVQTKHGRSGRICFVPVGQERAAD